MHKYKYDLPSMILLMLIMGCLLTLNSCTSSSNQVISFQLENPPPDSKGKIGIRGDQYPLSWNRTYFIEDLACNIVFADSITQLAYKYVIDDGENVTWENIDNRIAEFEQGHFFKSTWNKDDQVDITLLPEIKAEQLLEDFELVKTVILDVHPGTYRYADSAEVQVALEELSVTLTRKPSMTIGQAYLAFSKMMATIQCDHSKPGFNNQNRKINAIIHGQKDKLPFTFRWIDDQMIVELNASEENRLISGSEILSINGINVIDIKTRLFPYVVADGGTDHNRIKKLEVGGFDFRYNAFDVFFPLVFPLDEHKFVLEIQPPDGKIFTTEVEGIHRENRAIKLADRYPNFTYRRDETWNYKTEEDIGLLTLNSYGLMGWKGMTIDYRRFLDSVFTDLQKKNIEHLIIDIRKNNGGNDEMKIELFRYLTCNENCNLEIKREGRTRFTQFPEILKIHCQTWGDNPWYYQLTPDDTSGGYFIFQEKTSQRSVAQIKANAFKGNVFLLTSSANTSLAYYTARDFQWRKIGTIIGEETGGNLRDINGGQILFLRLPHSEIEIDFSIMGGFTLDNMLDSGVLPDIPVKWTKEDIIKGRDPHMEIASNLIRASSNK